MLRIAACQIDVALGQLEKNREKILSAFSSAAQAGARLVVFPECAVCGYCFDSLEEAASAALECPSPWWSDFWELCDRYEAYCVCGFIEKEEEVLYNTAGLFGPGRSLGKYRKMHTLTLGIDRFVREGDLGFPVFDLPVGKVGLNICYDQRFPESTRILMVKGAQLVVVPTNGPVRARKVYELLTQARAFENHIFYLLVNRIGSERGTEFMGLSTLVDPGGDIIFKLSENEEETGFADLDLSLSDQKHLVLREGEHEIDLLNDRRPSYYEEMIKKHSKTEQ